MDVMIENGGLQCDNFGWIWRRYGMEMYPVARTFGKSVPLVSHVVLIAALYYRVGHHRGKSWPDYSEQLLDFFRWSISLILTLILLTSS